MLFLNKISIAGSLILLLCAAIPAHAQDGTSLRKRFTNQDVIELVKMGLSDDVIIAKIRTAYAAQTDSVSMDTE